MRYGDSDGNDNDYCDGDLSLCRYTVVMCCVSVPSRICVLTYTNKI
jgi:hypothetical protein